MSVMKPSTAKPIGQHHRHTSPASSDCTISWKSDSRGPAIVSQRRRSASSSHGKREEVTQAALLRGRGDLSGARLCFNVTLESRPTSTKNPLRGLGMQLIKKEAVSEDGRCPELRVAQVADTCRGVPTALSQWNNQCRKKRQAAHVLRAGDALCAVNGSSDGDYEGMLEELASSSSTHARRLSVERELGHLLVPAGAPAIRLDTRNLDAVVVTSSSVDGGRDKLDILAESLAGLSPTSSTRSSGSARSLSKVTSERKGSHNSVTLSEMSTRAPTPTAREGMGRYLDMFHL